MRQIKIMPSYTNRTEKSFTDLINEVRNFPILSPGEEVELAKRMEKGDMEARNTLINCNLRFVISVAKEYQHRGVPLADLISAGFEGIINAADKYDHTRGFKFISYAVWWIRQAILLTIQETGHIIRLPINKQADLAVVNNAINQFYLREGRYPSDVELSDISFKTINNLPNISVGSLETPVNEATTMEGVLPSESKTDAMMDKESLSQRILSVLSNFKEREQTIIIHYFGLNGERPKSYTEIGDMVYLTPERVRQIKLLVLKKLHKYPGLREFLG